MRGSKAKKIRAVAQETAESVNPEDPWESYEAKKCARGYRTMVKLLSKFPSSMPLQEKMELLSGGEVYTARLKPLCGKGIYRKYKKAYKSGTLRWAV